MHAAHDSIFLRPSPIFDIRALALALASWGPCPWGGLRLLGEPGWLPWWNSCAVAVASVSSAEAREAPEAPEERLLG